MTTTDIDSLIENRQPFLVLKTYDQSVLTGVRTRHEIIPLSRLQSFTTAKIAGTNAINHLERYGSDEISLSDFNRVTESMMLTCKRKCRDGEIWEFCGCLKLYKDFSDKWIRENIGTLTH